MKVAVIGPGAMGCLYAGRLLRSGIRTTLVDHLAERAQRLTRSGITIESAGGSDTLELRVQTQLPSKIDLIIVLAKAYATPLLRLPMSVPVLTLQNGLGNVETICDRVGSAMVLGGTTSEAATLLDEGKVRHVAAGLTRVGAWTSCPTEPAQQALEAAGFRVEVTETPGQAIWEKAVISAGINPVTALLNVPNGMLLEIREARQLLRDLVVEAAKVAACEGYRYPYSLVERAEDICANTADNISSMLQDIRAGRRTEIDNISGEILRRGNAAHLASPRTRVIWQLIKTLEAK